MGTWLFSVGETKFEPIPPKNPKKGPNKKAHNQLRWGCSQRGCVQSKDKVTPKLRLIDGAGNPGWPSVKEDHANKAIKE